MTLENIIAFRKAPLDVFLEKLLVDKTTDKHIIWATDEYSEHGETYEDRYEITTGALRGINPVLLQPRAFKALATQQQRTKSKAEVFTPSWIVNTMINHLDEEWFGRKDVFNKEEGQGWKTNTDKIDFKEKKWKAYVDRSILEIACGEAPFIVSRYDASSGEAIPLEERIGVLDRKLRVVSENTDNEKDWLKWTKRAYESVYGYEYQGDNLLISRINLLMTFIDYYKITWNKEADKSLLNTITNIITWNFWQMDGLNGAVPLGIPQPKMEMITLSLFDDEEQQEEKAPLCKIRKWRTKKTMLYKEVEMKEGNDMGKKKWDVVIGNPPYQESTGENNKQAKPVYNLFVEAALQLHPETISMIMPSRWFAGGMGLDNFRNMMLNSKKITRITDYQNAKECFPGTSIGGGVCMVQIDQHPIHEVCSFTNVLGGQSFEEKRSLNEFDVLVRSNQAIEIIRKVKKQNKESVASITSSLMPFGLSTNFRGNQHPDSQHDIALFSSKDKTYVSKDQLKKGLEYLDKYHVLMSKTGSEHAGEPSKDGRYKVIPSSMRVLKPNEACTHSYFLIGNFNTLEEAENLEKYLKTKFSRFLILQSMTSINLSKLTLGFLPIQDFSNHSDLDWSAGLTTLDEQLYKKYKLSDNQKTYINELIKEME